jgi:glycosyltransferase involved in cell wall biosynthesis
MLFSLVCTAYNRPHYLQKAIDSALAQTFKDWELIIWDDGSTDDTRAIARDAAARDGRIWVGGSAANNGRAMALRNAIYASQGDWFGLLDSDDWLHTTALEIAAPATEADSCGLIYTDRFLVDQHGQQLLTQNSPCPELIRSSDIYGRIPFHLQLFRRSAFEKTAGVDTGLKAAIDYDLSLKMLELPDVGLTHIAKPLYYHRIHSDRISADIDTQTIEAMKVTRKAVDRRGLNLAVNLHWQIKPSLSNTRPAAKQ